MTTLDLVLSILAQLAALCLIGYLGAKALEALS